MHLQQVCWSDSYNPVSYTHLDVYKRQAEDSGATSEELRTLLGRGRAKKGIFEGDLEEGELEIGQVLSLIHISVWNTLFLYGKLFVSGNETNCNK